MAAQFMSASELQELCDLAAKTHIALRRAIHNTTPTQRSRFEASLGELTNTIEALKISSSFHRTFKQADQRWIPKGLIEDVVQACCDQRYEEDAIEAIFYRHGGIRGLLTLHLGTRFQTALFTELIALPLEFKVDLAKEFTGSDINPLADTWSDSFDTSRSKSDPQKELPRLYRLAKPSSRKRIRPETPTQDAELRSIPQTDGDAPAVGPIQQTSEYSGSGQTGSSNQMSAVYSPRQQQSSSFENIPLHQTLRFVSGSNTSTQIPSIGLPSFVALGRTNDPQNRNIDASFNNQVSAVHTLQRQQDLLEFGNVPLQLGTNAPMADMSDVILNPDSWGWALDLDFFNPNNE